MSQWLKQSTSITVRAGPFVDSTDGATAETGLTISQADIRLSKNGDAFAQSNNSDGAAHDENGWYSLTLDTTDTGTLGRLDLAVAVSGARPVQREFMVLLANTHDSLVSGSDYLQSDVIQIEGSDATDQIGDAVADEAYEGALTLRQIQRVGLAVLAGKSTGGGTSTIAFRDNADGKDRVSATVDSDGNRDAVTLDGS